jgi:putative flippase GtrA
MDLARIVKFAGVSGAGLCLDYAVYTVGCTSGLDAGVANLVSAACGVTFVFAVSARRIFASSDERFLLGLFLAYALYQLAAISLASWAVHGATALLDGRFLLAKTLVLPFSFSANYAFMSWLFGARERTRLHTPPAVPQRAGSPER